VSEAATSITQTSATLNATVNPGGEELSECTFEYGTTTAYGQSAPCSSLPEAVEYAVAVSAQITGLTANTTYHFRISATNPSGPSKGSDETFRTLPNPPTVVTEPASSITQTTASLKATVNPNAGEVSKCEFEYGTTTAYGSSASCSSLPGAGTSPVAVSAAVSGLAANTTYHFRISATNAGGTSKGADETFKTPVKPPTVVSEKATAIAQTTATLNGTVNPNGGEVSECKFEYGTTTEYKSTPVSCSSLPGNGTSAVAVSAPLTGLSANTTYHFRISATNAGGTSKGSDETFTTLPNCTAEGFCTSFTPPNNIEGSFREPDAVARRPEREHLGGGLGPRSGDRVQLETRIPQAVRLRRHGRRPVQGDRRHRANAPGDVYVTDYGNNRVQEFSPTGAFLRQFGSKGTRSGPVLRSDRHRGRPERQRVGAEQLRR
jgi:phosphodiesterase/alkaline phosphatase D-like protein